MASSSSSSSSCCCWSLTRSARNPAGISNHDDNGHDLGRLMDLILKCSALSEPGRWCSRERTLGLMYVLGVVGGGGGLVGGGVGGGYLGER